MSWQSFWKNLTNKADYTNDFWKNVGTAFNKIGVAFKNSKFGNGVSNLWRSVTGSGLTDAQREANAFEAQQAQNQMDFQERMSNTANQRGLADMKAAGLNPALMYGGSSSGASSPTGAMASSDSAGVPDVVGLMTALSNLSLLKAQRDNIRANTDKTRIDIDYTKQNIVESAARVKQIQANVRNLNLSGDAQEIINKYLDRKEMTALQNMSLEGDKLSAEWTEIQQKISNLSTEQQKMLQDIAESTERVNYLLSQQSLNSAQIDEIRTTIDKINTERDNLIKTGKLIDKDIDFYEWNHGSEISGLGVKPGTKYIPNRKERDKNR